MRRLTLLMTDEEKGALEELARRSYRDPRNQLLLILRKEAEEYGLLPTSVSGPAATREAARATAAAAAR